MLTDLIIVIVFFAILLFITLQKGKRFVISLILSFYFAITITKYLISEPATISLSDTAFTAAFVLVLIASYIGISKYVRNFKSNGGQGYFAAVMLSLSATFLALASYFYFLPEVYYTFTEEFKEVFIKQELALGAIFLLPIISLFISSKDD